MLPFFFSFSFANVEQECMDKKQMSCLRMCLVSMYILKTYPAIFLEYKNSDIVPVFLKILDSINDVTILRPALTILEDISATSEGELKLIASQYKSIRQFLKGDCFSEHPIALRILCNIYSSQKIKGVETGEIMDLIVYLKRPEIEPVTNDAFVCALVILIFQDAIKEAASTLITLCQPIPNTDGIGNLFLKKLSKFMLNQIQTNRLCM